MNVAWPGSRVTEMSEMPGMDRSSVATEPVQWAQDMPEIVMVVMISLLFHSSWKESQTEGNARVISRAGLVSVDPPG